MAKKISNWGQGLAIQFKSKKKKIKKIGATCYRNKANKSSPQPAGSAGVEGERNKVISTFVFISNVLKMYVKCEKAHLLRTKQRNRGNEEVFRGLIEINGTFYFLKEGVCCCCCCCCCCCETYVHTWQSPGTVGDRLCSWGCYPRRAGGCCARWSRLPSGLCGSHIHSTVIIRPMSMYVFAIRICNMDSILNARHEMTN